MHLMQEAPDSEHLSGRVDHFKQVLAEQADDHGIVNQHLLHGSCFAIDDDAVYSVKNAIAGQYGLQAITDVFVVGSSKLGFSIAPQKRYRHFGQTSDIDIAIINHDLYQKVWHEVDEYSRSGSYWPDKDRFNKYMSKGWIRPDKLPSSPIFGFAAEWFRFFRSLQANRIAGEYKVSAAIYHDMEFLVRYQSEAVSKCRNAR